MIYRIMTKDGKFPQRNYGPYTDLFYNEGHAKRCKNAISRFNKGVELVIEGSEVQWIVNG